MMRRPGGFRFALVLLAVGPLLGCEGAKPPQAPRKPAVPLAIRRPDSRLLVFSGDAETPGTAYEFKGASGSVRVTMEVEGASAPVAANPPHAEIPPPPKLNDVLFKAEGDGQISVAFKRPSPEHPNGRVTIACLSGGEESSAEFEPELWYHLPGAIVTLEPTGVEPKDQAVLGKEIVLGRYVARNIPTDIRLTFKAIFTRDPVAPRTKAAPRSRR
jgi:hypothetical protein